MATVESLASMSADELPSENVLIKMLYGELWKLFVKQDVSIQEFDTILNPAGAVGADPSRVEVTLDRRFLMVYQLLLEAIRDDSEIGEKAGILLVKYLRYIEHDL
ncbi:MAG: hypothetical protein M1355_01825 [Patescibacteria group bacterium]|nr:hypothetical protein [Patescibacteria group bacterium]